MSGTASPFAGPWFDRLTMSGTASPFAGPWFDRLTMSGTAIPHIPALPRSPCLTSAYPASPPLIPSLSRDHPTARRLWGVELDQDAVGVVHVDAADVPVGAGE